jgi:hypothetical protein
MGLVAALVSSGVVAGEDHLWAKVGATDAAAASALDACHAESKGRRYHLPDRTTAAAMMGGGALPYLLAAGELALDQKSAEAAFVRHCMRRHGYVWLPLKSDETAALAKLTLAPDRAAWIDRFYAATPVARLDSAWAPVAPALPEGVEEPLTFDGLKLEPATLTVVTGIVAKGGVVLSGPVGHVQTARLVGAVDAPVIPELNAAAGTIFYQVVTPTDFDPEQTYWCGPMTYYTPSGPRTLTYCVDVGEKGYEFNMAGVEDWYAPPPFPGMPQMRTKAVKLALAPSEKDLLGRMDLTLTAARIDKKFVDLHVSVASGKRHQRIWILHLPFEADGTAVLPFWTHRLVLTRAGDGVTAAFTADGDGRGWLDVNPEP